MEKKGLRCCANGTRPVKCTFRFSFSHFRRSPRRPYARARARAGSTRAVPHRKAFQLKFKREVAFFGTPASTAACTSAITSVTTGKKLTGTYLHFRREPERRAASASDESVKTRSGKRISLVVCRSCSTLKRVFLSFFLLFFFLFSLLFL